MAMAAGFNALVVPHAPPMVFVEGPLDHAQMGAEPHGALDHGTDLGRQWKYRTAPPSRGHDRPSQEGTAGDAGWALVDKHLQGDGRHQNAVISLGVSPPAAFRSRWVVE